MRISFVVYDGYFEKCSKVVNLVINHYDGGYQAGKVILRLQRSIRRHLLGQKLQSSALKQCAMEQNVRQKLCCRLR